MADRWLALARKPKTGKIEYLRLKNLEEGHVNDYAFEEVAEAILSGGHRVFVEHDEDLNEVHVILKTRSNDETGDNLEGLPEII